MQKFNSNYTKSEEKINIRSLLTNSVFYPASGTDDSDIACLLGRYNSFIHVDYSLPRKEVKEALLCDYPEKGYRLISFRQLLRHELKPADFIPANIDFNNEETERLDKYDFIRKLFFQQQFYPYAFLAYYEKEDKSADYTGKKNLRFSLLHIGGEACTAFNALYSSYQINPAAVAIINPGEGYGDNWTSFRNPDFRFYQSIANDCINHGSQMPKILLTNMVFDIEQPCYWPDYSLNPNSYLGTEGQPREYLYNG